MKISGPVKRFTHNYSLWSCFMKILKVLMSTVLATASLHALCDAKKDECSKHWSDAMQLKDEKDYGFAATKASLFLDNSCLDFEIHDTNKHEKKHLIALIRAESYLSGLDGVTSLTPSFTPSAGMHAHTTS